MKILKIGGMLILLLVFAFGPQKTDAQCIPSKYGITPIWPILWDLQEQADWFETMSNHGMGYLHTTNNWRLLQEMADSNRLSAFRDQIASAKTQYGFDKYLFQFQNPAAVTNFMPPLYCGNPLTNANTMAAMYNFITLFIDTMNPVLDYFVFGGDVELYFKTRPAELDSFVVLAHQVSDYIDSNYPAIKFGVAVNFRSGIKYDQSIWNRVKPFSDMLVLTYWPVPSNFMVEPTAIDSVEFDIADMVAAAESKPIVILGSGLPTASALGGSEALQADFVRETFVQTMNIPQIEAVGFDYLADFDTTQIYWYQNFYITYDPNFYHYISSLGLMDSLGNPKAAYPVYLAMLDTVCLHSSIAEQNIETKFSVFPNPFCNHTYIESASQSASAQFCIRNLNGTIVAEGTISGRNSSSINLETFADGIYVLEISANDQSNIERKLIIKSCTN
jgi:hypothetical protein